MARSTCLCSSRSDLLPTMTIGMFSSSLMRMISSLRDVISWSEDLDVMLKTSRNPCPLFMYRSLMATVTRLVSSREFSGPKCNYQIALSRPCRGCRGSSAHVRIRPCNALTSPRPPVCPGCTASVAPPAIHYSHRGPDSHQQIPESDTSPQLSGHSSQSTRCGRTGLERKGGSQSADHSRGFEAMPAPTS